MVILLLLGLFPYGVAGMVLNRPTILPLCPVQCVLLRFNPIHSISLLHESFHLVFCIPLRPIPGVGASNSILSTCPSYLLLTCPYHFRALSLWFSLSLCYFTDPHTCSFLSSSFFVTPHIQCIIVISFALSIFSCFFVVDHFPVLYSHASITTVLYRPISPTLGWWL